MSKAILPVEFITTILHTEIQEEYCPMTRGSNYIAVCIADVMGGKCGKHDE
jgi:hypothetical protein